MFLPNINRMQAPERAEMPFLSLVTLKFEISKLQDGGGQYLEKLKNRHTQTKPKDVSPNINPTGPKNAVLSLVTLTLTYDLDLQTRQIEGPNTSSV